VRGLLIVGAEVDSRPNTDIRMRGETIVEMGSGLTPRGERVIGAQGGAVIPGLHDHHLHNLTLGDGLLNRPRVGAIELQSHVDRSSGWSVGRQSRGLGCGALPGDLVDRPG
jgi:predicted amidohydrolase YtcJ